MTKSIIIKIAVVLIGILVVFLGRGFFYYNGFYQAPPSEMPSYEQIVAPAAPSTEFSDVYEEEKGVLIVDVSHDNNFAPWELNVLLSRVTSRGFGVKLLEKPEDPKLRLENLEKKLRFADALVIISPGLSFSEEEAESIKKFVGKGGKLLLVEDPTRRHRVLWDPERKGVAINSISAEFGLIFEPDYLYNMKENDGNYRYVFFRKPYFEVNEITKNLEEITFYDGGSISSPGLGIVFADENTFSSFIETKGRLSPVALSEGSKVLAISDLTFMIEPFNASFDNNRFISNIADWLTLSVRVFSFSDFPYFLEDNLKVAYADASLIEIGLELKNFFERVGKSPELGQYEKEAEKREIAEVSQDTVFIGIFEDGTKVEEYLKRGNISITETEIELENIGQLSQEKTSLLYLDESSDRKVLIILADAEETLKDTIALLKSGEFRKRLVTDILAICQWEEEPEEQVESNEKD